MTFTAVKPIVNDAALLQLYDLLHARHAPKPGSYSTLTEEQRRAYHRDAARRQRQKVKLEQANAPRAYAATIRSALADAALMLLAIDGPGASAITRHLEQVFSAHPAIATTVRARAKAGTLRPKFAKRRRPA